ncbi:hypothetical protein [Ferrovum sp.]|uniref:hypothetical protein n=1 Tax=Ferrovum sp. TaxID=2609467 RepID=UPI00261489E8|nr:hypothetical protein [Ferrovum sp.]
MQTPYHVNAPHQFLTARRRAIAAAMDCAPVAASSGKPGRYRSGVRASQRILFTDGSIARIEWIRHVTRKERLELYCLRLDD